MINQNLHCWSLAVLALVLAMPQAEALETPSSFGAPSRVDTPILRIPFMASPPEIDGVMKAGEWADSSALSGFWYDRNHAKFKFLAPHQTQVKVHVGYDKENLYFAYISPVYPKNSWLKARARFPDVVAHPLYGLQWDDHLELELRPYHDNVVGFNWGLFKWFINPINTHSDQFWSTYAGDGRAWKSGIKTRSVADGELWVAEVAVPLADMVHGRYDGSNEQGQKHVQLPPPDGTAYRCWFVRGIGGNTYYFNAFDNHVWNTTKTKLVFDSKAPSFQINDLGPIMDDEIDVTVTIKNHNSRSETIRMGFFVESAEGLIYTSYEDPELNGGLLELRPGEVRTLNLRQPLPGVSQDGNVLWFDVRSAGKPAKSLFLTRLIHFHSMEGGRYPTAQSVPDGEGGVKTVNTFKEARLDVIEALRPPRKDFDFRWSFSNYTRTLSVVVDKGIHGASEEAKRAVEAKLMVMKNNEDEDVVVELGQAFSGDFATFVVDLSDKVVDGESYSLALLLFDDKKRIVGERNPDPFQYKIEAWQGNQLGLDDVVWEPFLPIVVKGSGLETLKHHITVSPSGLPAQITIKPDTRELPLELRDGGKVSAEELLRIGRGEQLRAPIRLVATIAGKAIPAKVTTAAKLVRQWKSECEYKADLDFGGLPATMTTRYDCDGSMHLSMSYGGKAAPKIDKLELVADFKGTVDQAFSATIGGMAASDVWECQLPMKPGVVWDSTSTQMELFYNKFIQWFWLGSGERGFSWFCDSDRGWGLDREGSSMRLERNAQGDVSWYVSFVNHPQTVAEARTIDFSILVHPSKPKPENYRAANWHFRGDIWAAGYQKEPIELDEAYLKKQWRTVSGAPDDLPYEQAATFRQDHPPYNRNGRWRNVGVTPEMDQMWEDKGIYYMEQQVRIGRRTGWWWDEYWPNMGDSDNLAAGNAHLRRPEDVKKNELPWHRGWVSTHMRNFQKRLARVQTANNVPVRSHTWANNAASLCESFMWNGMLVEECGSDHRSFDVDMVSQFPSILYRYLARPWSGLVVHQLPGPSRAKPGDDKRLDRQYFGRALLHDIGAQFNGPHGRIQHKEQAIRLLGALAKFGLFKDENTEFAPYWGGDAPTMLDAAGKPLAQLYVSAYRRPRSDGKGYQVIYIVMNESSEVVEAPLHLHNRKRMLVAANRLTAADVYRRAAVDEDLAGWWAQTKSSDQGPVLRDIESGDYVASVAGKIDVYGPLRVPVHDFRVLYAESEVAQ